MLYPDFTPAKREDVPDYVTANIYGQARQNQQYLQQLENSREDQKDLMSLPGKGYTMYTDLTGHEPLKDLVNKWRKNRELPPPGSTNDMMPTQNVINPGTGPTPPPQAQAAPTPMPDQMTPGGSPGFSPAGTAAGAGLGGVTAALAANQQGMHRDKVIGKGVGGAALGALPMTAAPLAAAGPPGWAALAGQSALALYGLLG